MKTAWRALAICLPLTVGFAGESASTRAAQVSINASGLTGECPPDTKHVELEVNKTPTVSFSWKPACAVAMVLVEESPGGSDQWGISTAMSTWTVPSEANRISPLLKYGDVVSSTSVLEKPRELTQGIEYQVVLWRVMQDSTAPGCVARRGYACMIGYKKFKR